MKNKFIVTVIMLLITTTCFGFVESYEENKIDKQVNSNYDYYNQATVIIFGSCDSAYVVGFSWRFGLYIPKVRRTIHIDANGVNESFSAVVLKSNEGFGMYLNNNDMHIRLTLTKGIFFYGGKSILTTSNIIIGVCNARQVTVSY